MKTFKTKNKSKFIETFAKRKTKYNIANKYSKSWKLITIWGNTPYDRGLMHGKLLKNELLQIKKIFPFYIHEEFGISMKKYFSICSSVIIPRIKLFMNGEYWDEMLGIADGCGLSVIFIVAINSLLSMYDYLHIGSENDNIANNNIGIANNNDNTIANKKSKIKTKNKRGRCSAFIATGNGITKDGKIIMAHNTHTDYIISQFQNIILRIVFNKNENEDKENKDWGKFDKEDWGKNWENNNSKKIIIMQTMAGSICSGMDWFICSNGMIGCETTIADINYDVDFNNGFPYFLRIRRAMQYANSLDEYKTIMLQNNAGDYPCSWLFGDCKTNEIALLEIGLKLNNWEIKDNGVFYSMNIANNIHLRYGETIDRSFMDLQSSSGSRNSRFSQLLLSQYLGNIDISIAKKIIADHYDSSIGKNNMGDLTICNHSEFIDDFKPYGATDGKVYSASDGGQFWGIFGHPCGVPFIAKKWFQKYKKLCNGNDNGNDNNNCKYLKWINYLKDMKKGKWELLHFFEKLKAK